MTITREFSIMGEKKNVNITLTDSELDDAYLECQHNMDEDAIISYLADSDTEYDEDKIPDELIDKMANELRTGIGNLDWSGVLDSVMENHKAELSEYERRFRVFSKEVTVTITKTYTIKAKDKDDADRIFDAWSESNVRQMEDDMTEDLHYNGEWDYGWTEEEEDENPDYADISEEDI